MTVHVPPGTAWLRLDRETRSLAVVCLIRLVRIGQLRVAMMKWKSQIHNKSVVAGLEHLIQTATKGGRRQPSPSSSVITLKRAEAFGGVVFDDSVSRTGRAAETKKRSRGATEFAMSKRGRTILELNAEILKKIR